MRWGFERRKVGGRVRRVWREVMMERWRGVVVEARSIMPLGGLLVGVFRIFLASRNKRERL